MENRYPVMNQPDDHNVGEKIGIDKQLGILEMRKEITMNQ
jgi:hypothetical protein